MDDIKYDYYQDIKSKKSTAIGAKHMNIRHRRPQINNYTNKEWKKMNGELTMIDLSKKYSWTELRIYDLRIVADYLDNLVRRFGCNNQEIYGEVLLCSEATYWNIRSRIKKQLGREILMGRRGGISSMSNIVQKNWAEFLDPSTAKEPEPEEPIDIPDDNDETDSHVVENRWSPTPSEIIIRYGHVDSMENDIISNIKQRLAGELYELLSNLADHEEVAITISLSKNIKNY